jgi:hypothetical protein
VQLAPHTWIGVDGQPLALQTDAELLEFLRRAEMEMIEEIATGVTRPHKVMLALGDVVAHGIFRDVDERETKADFGAGGSELFFRDNAGFERAAYELGALLNVPHISPVVDRVYRHAGQLG